MTAPPHTDLLPAGAPARRAFVALASLAAASAAVALAASRWPLIAAWLAQRRLAATSSAPALAELLRRVAADLRSGGAAACEEAVAAFDTRFAARGAAEAASASASPELAAARRAQRAEATLAAARAAAEELVRASMRRHAQALELDADALGAAFAAAQGDAAVREAGRALAEAHPLHAAPALLRELKAEMLRRDLEAQAEARRDWLAAAEHVAAAGGNEEEEEEGADAATALSAEQRRLAQQLALGARAGAPPPPLASRQFAAYLSRRMTAAGATVLGGGPAPCFTVDVLRQRGGLLDRARLFGVMIEHAHEEEARRVPQAARRTHAVQHLRLLRSHRDKMAQLGLHGVLEAGLLAHEGEVNT